MIESVVGWDLVPELAEAHARHMRSSDAMRRVRCEPSLDAVTRVVVDYKEANKDMIGLMLRGMQRLLQRPGHAFSETLADQFLNSILESWLGSNVLLSHYLACAGEPGSQTGIVDPSCDVVGICSQTAADVQGLCHECTGLWPLVQIKTYFSEGDPSPKIPLIPTVLRYILQELLKNSCRATAEAVEYDFEFEKKPIAVHLCADEQHMIVHISDRAGGIPFEVGQRVWSYNYTTVCRDVREATPLAGHGVGLPLSRLYANFLGGSLNLVSLPGYGTHAFLSLPRLPWTPGSQPTPRAPARAESRAGTPWTSAYYMMNTENSNCLPP